MSNRETRLREAACAFVRADDATRVRVLAFNAVAELATPFAGLVTAIDADEYNYPEVLALLRAEYARPQGPRVHSVLPALHRARDRFDGSGLL